MFQSLLDEIFVSSLRGALSPGGRVVMVPLAMMILGSEPLLFLPYYRWNCRAVDSLFGDKCEEIRVLGAWEEEILTGGTLLDGGFAAVTDVRRNALLSVRVCSLCLPQKVVKPVISPFVGSQVTRKSYISAMASLLRKSP